MWDLRFFLLRSPECVTFPGRKSTFFLKSHRNDFETKLGDVSLDRKPAITSLVIIIPSADAIMEILAETVSRAHTWCPLHSPKEEGLPVMQSAGKRRKETLTLKYAWEFIAFSEAGSKNAFMQIYSDVLAELHFSQAGL